MCTFENSVLAMVLLLELKFCPLHLERVGRGAKSLIDQKELQIKRRSPFYSPKPLGFAILYLDDNYNNLLFIVFTVADAGLPNPKGPTYYPKTT